MVRRRGLIRSAARTAGRTAVIAGTATAVSGRVADRQQQKRAAHHAPAIATAPHPHAASSSGGDMVVHLQQLADLKAAGALTDKEFAAAKARLFKS